MRILPLLPWPVQVRSLHRAAVAVALIMVVVSLWRARQEDAQFARLVNQAFPAQVPSAGVITSQANATLLLHHVHAVVNEQSRRMGADRGMNGLLFWSPGDHLKHPGGSCASYSTVLARALQTAGFQVRKVGLAKDGRKALHHVVETLADGHWVLMDALFNLAFRRRDGQLASAREVSLNWPFYRQQTPPNYPPGFDYSGFYYTNWDRFPGSSLVFRLWPTLPVWLQAHEVSLRFIFLDVWRWLAAFWGLVAVGLLILGRWLPRAHLSSRALPDSISLPKS